MQFKNTEKLNMSTEILKGISKTLSHFPPLKLCLIFAVSLYCVTIINICQWAVYFKETLHYINFIWEDCSVFILGRIFTTNIWYRCIALIQICKPSFLLQNCYISARTCFFQSITLISILRIRFEKTLSIY